MSTTKINPAHIWRNDITGLRAVAVLPVLLFHAFPNLLPGGFFGVDVFFVISGYLISGIIFRGLIDGTFSYRTFYEKRIKRIIPNLLLVLTFVSILGYIFLVSTEFDKLGKHIFASSIFIQNIRLLRDVGYFADSAQSQPLLHLWSLAIEEQFYIIFPIICALVWKFFKSSKAIGSTVAFITIGSLVACFAVQNRDFSFYFPLTRFWELGAGIALAFAETYGHFPSRQMTLGLRHGLSLAGLAGILAPMFLMSSELTHPGWITLFPVIGAVFIIAANPDAVVNRSLLSWRPMTFVGLISYSLYLWHWPMLSFLHIVNPTAPSYSPAVALFLSFIVASVVYFFVENPVRRSNKLFGVPTVAILLIGLVIAAGWGQALRKYDGFPQRNVYPEFTRINATSEWNDAVNNAPKIRINNVDIPATLRSERPVVVLAGDSHAYEYFRRLVVLSKETDINAAGIFGPAFFVLEGVRDDKKNQTSEKTELLFDLIADKNVKSLILGQIWGEYFDKPQFETGIRRLRNALKSRPDLRVFVLLDAPYSKDQASKDSVNYDPLRHFNRWNFNRADFIVPYPKDDTWKKGNEAITKALGDVATIISVEEHVCPNKTCDLYDWYRDANHLQPQKLETRATWLNQVFNGLRR